MPRLDPDRSAVLRVLLVEDEFLVALDAEDMLRSFGFREVHVEGRVAPALAAIAREPFDVAVLDMNLYGQRSDSVAAALRARAIPFVVTTGYQLSESDLASFGNPPYVRKPYGVAQLHKAIERVLGAAPVPARAASAALAGGPA